MKNRSFALSSVVALAVVSGALVPSAQARPKTAPPAPDITTTATAATPPTAPASATTPASTSNAAVLAATSIGVVDEDTLRRNYKKYRDEFVALKARLDDLLAKVPARELLTADETKEFDTLVVKADATPAEKARFDTLVTNGFAKRQEYNNLIGKASRSDTEAARMKELQGLMAANRDSMDPVAQSVVEALSAQGDDIDKKFADTANSVVGQVAAEKKLVVIMSKRGLVWWSNTIDITNDVLTRLNQ